MPAKNKQLSVYPDPTALAIVGGNSPACNRAIECWAHVLRESMPELDRAEWNYLADALNGTILDETWSGEYLIAEVSDAHELNRLGDKWFIEETASQTAARAAGKRNAKADAAVKRFLAKLQDLSYAQAQYVLAAVAFFWEHTDPNEIDANEDAWWEIPFRVQLTTPQRS